MTTYIARFFDAHGRVALEKTATLAALLATEEEPMSTDSEIAALAIAFVRAKRANLDAHRTLEMARARAVVEGREAHRCPNVVAAERAFSKTCGFFAAEQALEKACVAWLDGLTRRVSSNDEAP